MRILIVDDYKTHGESLADLLSSKGHEAIYAESYADAEWLLELMRFDLALLDFDMPGMSGPTVAAKLTARHPSLRSVILSAHVPTGERLVELGGLPFLAKPVPTTALLQMLEQVARELAGLSLIQRSAFSIVKYK
jgi:DNA-binding NtrC family response regulator